MQHLSRSEPLDDEAQVAAARRSPAPAHGSTGMPPFVLRAARLAEHVAASLSMPAAFVDHGGDDGAIAVGSPPPEVDGVLVAWQPPAERTGPATLRLSGASVVAFPLTVAGRAVWVGAIDPAGHTVPESAAALHALLVEMEADGRAQRAATIHWVRRLEDENRRMARAQRLVGAGTLVYDVAGDALETSTAALEILGRTDVDTLEDFVLAFDPFDRSVVTQAMTGRLGEADTFDVHREILLPHESRRVVRLHGEVERLDGAPARIVATLQDVTAERARIVEMRRMAETDALTGVANRSILERALREATRIADAERLHAALLLVDVDDFKGLNDTFGHLAGDEVLKFVARAVTSVTRGSDTVLRLGGDQFAVVVGSAVGADGLMGLAGRIASALDTRVDVAGEKIRISASVGVAVYPEDVSPSVDLNRAADEALSEAKSVARGSVRRFDRSLWARKESRRSMIARVREGLARSEFVPFFQPKMELSTGCVVGFEALCRWRHPDHGILGPGAFFGAFDDAEVGGPLSDVALVGSFEAARLFRERGLSVGHIAINLSRAQLARESLVDDVRRLQDEHGVTADEIVFEVLENVLIRDQRNVYGNLAALSDLGFRVALDDFGTGFASLSHIREPFIREVKVDRSFVMDAASRPNDFQIVAAIVQMARKLGLSVVAEGIQDEETLRKLVTLGCGVGQGFVFAPALSFDEALRFVARQARITALVSDRNLQPEEPRTDPHSVETDRLREDRLHRE